MLPGVPMEHQINSSLISLIAITKLMRSGETLASFAIWLISSLIRLFGVSVGTMLYIFKMLCQFRRIRCAKKRAIDGK